MYSRRQIKYFYYLKTDRKFELETYNFLGLLGKKFTFDTKDLKLVLPLTSGKIQRKVGVYTISFEEKNKKKQKFYFRPVEIHNKELFDLQIRRKLGGVN
jgi:hypothetical protein